MRAPERIWFADRPDDDLTMRLLAAPPGPEDVGYVEYVRVDLHEARVADADRLRREIDALRADNRAARRHVVALGEEVDELRGALARIAAVDPYAMDPDPDMSREAQNWATLNGVVTWARQALAAPADGSIQGPSCSCGGAGCVACDHPTESVGGLDVGAETQADRSGLGTHPNTEGGSRG